MEISGINFNSFENTLIPIYGDITLISAVLFLPILGVIDILIGDNYYDLYHVLNHYWYLFDQIKQKWTLLESNL